MEKETCYVYMLVNGDGQPIIVHSQEAMLNEDDAIDQIYCDLIESGEFEYWRPNQHRDYQLSFFRMEQGPKGYEVHRFTSHLNWLISNEMPKKALSGFRDTARNCLERIHSGSYRISIAVNQRRVIGPKMTHF